MANTPKKHPSGRRAKDTKTIDLEANPVAGDGSGEKTDATDKPAADKPDGNRTQKASGSGTASKSSVPRSGVAKPADKKADAQADAKPGPESAKDETVSRPSGDKPSKASNPQATESRGGGGSLFSMLVSGLVGGVVTLGGVGVLNSTGNLQSIPIVGQLFDQGADTGDGDAVNAKLAELSARIDEIAAGSGGSDLSASLAGLSEKVSAIETEMADAGSSNDDSEALAKAEAAQQKADDVAARIAELNDRIVNSAGGADIDIEAVKAALSEENRALAGRLDTLENEVRENGTGGQVAEEIAGIRDRLAALGQIDASVESVNDKTTALSGDLEELGGKLSGITERIASLETSVNEKILPSMSEVEKAATAAIESQSVARSVSARALGNVLEQGGRFNSELAAAEALAGESAAINELRPIADSGIQTGSQLLAGFRTVADTIRASETAKTAGDGIFEKFMASAKSLVKVRPAGPVSGEGTGAILSRIEAALESGEIETAREEWSSLDEAAKSASAGWVTELDKRISAKRLIETVIDQLSAEAKTQPGSEG